MENGWYVITPLMAKEWLKKNISNYRLINSHAVKAYAADMKAGKWVANGESIVFCKSGRLLNGQHRLSAIVKANVSVKSYVIFDVEDDVVDFDSGYLRSSNQRLRARGIQASNLGIAISRIVYNGGVRNGKSPHAIIEDYYANNYDSIKATESIISALGNIGRKAACGAVVYCMLKSNEMPENEMRDFFKVLNSGNSAESEREASPALVLRRQLEKMTDGCSASQSKRLEFTIKALNDFHSQHTRKRDYTDDTKIAENLIYKVQVLDKFGAP